MSLEQHPLVRDWIGVSGDRVVVHTGKVDFGQRISTALARIAAEEFALSPEDVDVAEVRTGAAPDEGMTSGSNSVVQSGNAVRRAAATARQAVFARVAAKMGVPADELDLADGFVAHRGSNRKTALTEALAGLDPALAVDPDAPPRPRAEIGAPASHPPRGMRAMVEGRYTYLHDLDVDGMLHARPVHPPHIAARLREIDAAVIEKLEAGGVRVIRDGSFLAVAAPGEWAAIQAAGRLARACDWDGGPGLPEIDVVAALRDNPAVRLPVIDGRPEPDAALPPAPDAPDLEAEFTRPYQMHGALGPSAAMASWNEGKLTIHTHSQGIYPLRESICESLDLPLDAVELVHVPGSGCYGHNGADDAAFEAALMARALPGTPVLLKWTRDDEHAFEPYATAMRVHVAARLDGQGDVAAYFAEASGDTHRGRPRAGPDRAGPARLLANRLRADPLPPYRAEPNMNREGGNHRNLTPGYAFPETRLVKRLVRDLPLRTSAMRCLGAVANVFALESVMDEAAAKAGADPFAYRRRYLTDPRDLAVLDRLEARLRDAPDPADGAGRGIAIARYKNQMARVALSVDLAVNDRAEIILQHAIIVADSGRIVDPAGVAAQLEGGFVQGASWALHEAVTWDRDAITSRDWDSYPVIRFDNIPPIETLLVDQPDCPSLGVGEASPGPAVAAIANAVHAATGLRLRRMPFTPEAVMEAALLDDAG